MIEELLFGYGALSISYTHLENSEEFYELNSNEVPLWKLVKVGAIFEKKIADNDLNKVLEKTIYSDLSISIFKEKDWVKSYQKDHIPLKFGRNLWVFPTWHEPPGNSKGIFIKIDPGMAFGSGSHETTQLCLEYLDKNNPKKQVVIDFGCGSGILSIAAALLGAKNVIAIDNDPTAISVTNFNTKLNSVDSKILTTLDYKEISCKADLVIANIFSNVLIYLKTTFYRLIKPSGVVVLSGIIEGNLKSVLEAYEDSFFIENVHNKNGWYMIILRKIDELQEAH